MQGTGYNQNSLATKAEIGNCWSEKQKLFTRLKNFCCSHNIKYPLKNTDFGIQSSEKFVLLALNEVIPSYEYWKEFNDKCKAQGKKAIIITDNFLSLEDLECVKFYSNPEMIGVFAVTDSFVTPQRRTKKYNCFMNRIESSRQSWFYFLHIHGLLDQGYVSFLLTQLSDYSTLTGKELFSYIHKTYQLDQLGHFEKAYQELKDMVPYRNFDPTANLDDLILDSKYSLILESYAANDINDRWSFSEKSFRTLQLPSLPLFFGQPNAVKKLESLGLIIGVDHSEFEHLPWYDRQRELLNILIEDTIDLDETVLYNQCMHNRDVMNNLLLKCQQDDFFDEFFTLVLEQ
jgi:hypothetical protein